MWRIVNSILRPGGLKAGEILVFKDEKHAFLSVDDLLSPLVVDAKVDALGRPDLIGGSLYVPASVGTLVVGTNKYINWDVYGHIILEPDIEVNSYTEVNMLSHAGDVVLNNTKIHGNTANNVNINADSGSIKANQTQIITSASYGNINLEAKLDINLDLANITSNGAGVNIQSVDGSIDASNATISSTNEGSSIDIQSSGQINVSEATVTCNGSGGLSIISEAEGIDASKATISSTNGGSSIDIQSSGQINVSEAKVTCNGSGGLSIISEAEGIDASKATISSTNEGSSIDIQSSGQINVSEATVTCNGSGGLSIISEAEGIDASKATISSTNGGSSIDIQSSGQINVSEAKVTCNGSGGLSIISEAEGIDASKATISSTNDAKTADVIIQATGPINLDGATVESESSGKPPSPALLIESTNDGISAKHATLTTTSAVDSLDVLAQGLIELDQATVSANGSINISSSGDISARSAHISNAGWGHHIVLSSTNGAIDLSTLDDEVGRPQTVVNCPSGNIQIHASGNIAAISAKMSVGNGNFMVELISNEGQINLSSKAGLAITDIGSVGNILIKAGLDIHCEESKLTASSNGGKELRFQSTGVNSKLWVQDAILGGHGIFAVELQIQGTPASGNIQQL
jgi:filamentous hemagglutinin